MKTDAMTQFAGQKYLCLETFRKNGQGVATPVWFAEGDGVIYVRTGTDTGKYKRVRNNPRVRIAPCTGRGIVTGAWVDGEARLVDGSEAERGFQFLSRKYGLLKRIIDGWNEFRGIKYEVIEIRV